MSAMSIDIWSEPLIEPVTNTTNVETEDETRSSKRTSLFLSDSEDEDSSRRQRDNAQAIPPSKDNDAIAAPETSRLDAMFADLDDDDDVFTVEPALDVDKLKRQAAARVAASSATVRSVVPSLTPDAAVDGGGPPDKDKDEKTKKARRVVAKLDEERLLGADGFPRLIKDCKNFKVTGKGHEVADLEKLFRLYHGWTHKMYPKFQFKDTVDRVEKLCRSRRMAVNMRAWKDEANGVTPEVRHTVTQDDEGAEGVEGDGDDVGSAHGSLTGAGPPSSSPSSSRPSTPVTRPGSAASTAPSVPSSMTDNDGMDIDIDALLREEEEMMREINGANKGVTSYKPSDPVDDDDALWVAAGGIPEELPAEVVQQKSTSSTRDEVDDEGLWDIAAEMEAGSRPMSQPNSAGGNNHAAASEDPPTAPTEQPNIGGDWDDMYA